jgi:hypothetical protein
LKPAQSSTFRAPGDPVGCATGPVCGAGSPSGELPELEPDDDPDELEPDAVPEEPDAVPEEEPELDTPELELAEPPDELPPVPPVVPELDPVVVPEAVPEDEPPLLVPSAELPPPDEPHAATKATVSPANPMDPSEERQLPNDVKVMRSIWAVTPFWIADKMERVRWKLS